jgi:sugar O-acyltransferase (sialic acid O-acetyltransferase NeuD family)
MEARNRLVIVGDSAIAEIAYEYFTHDSPYEVVGFAVEQAYLTRDTLFDLPVVPFERVTEHFPPAAHSLYAAVGYNQLNRLRTRLASEGKAAGYALASYVSSKAFVWRNVTMGEHCFIFEGNVVQPFVTMGDNVVLWSGNHIGHHSRIRDNVFFASHVVLSGFCDVGDNCFLGVNATVANNVTIAPDGLLGAGCMILRDTAPNTIYGAKMTEPASRTARQYFKLADDAA